MHEYKTQSLSLAAALQIVSLAKLEYIERIPNVTKAIFCFNPELDPDFHQIVARFFANQLPVDAATYFDALRFLKSRLYEESTKSNENKRT